VFDVDIAAVIATATSIATDSDIVVTIASCLL
jgi:hypothetical protein